MSNRFSSVPRASARNLYALDMDKWKFRPHDNYARAGGNGFGLSEKQVMYTIDTTIVHAVAICSPHSSQVASLHTRSAREIAQKSTTT